MVIKYIKLCSLLFSLYDIFLRSIQVDMDSSNSLLCVIFHHLNIPCPIYLLWGHLDCFQLFLIETILIDTVKLPSKVRNHLAFPPEVQQSSPFPTTQQRWVLINFIFATLEDKNKVVSCGDFNLLFLASLVRANIFSNVL